MRTAGLCCAQHRLPSPLPPRQPTRLLTAAAIHTHTTLTHGAQNQRRQLGCALLRGPGTSEGGSTHVLRRLVAVDPLAVWRQEAHLVLGDALLVTVGIEDLAQRGSGGGKATGLSVPAAQGALVLTW